MKPRNAQFSKLFMSTFYNFHFYEYCEVIN